MLDPWIIEEIKKREERRRKSAEREQIRIEVPLEERPPQEAEPAPSPERGVVVIDI